MDTDAGEQSETHSKRNRSLVTLGATGTFIPSKTSLVGLWTNNQTLFLTCGKESRSQLAALNAPMAPAEDPQRTTLVPAAVSERRTPKASLRFGNPQSNNHDDDDDDVATKQVRPKTRMLR